MNWSDNLNCHSAPIVRGATIALFLALSLGTASKVAQAKPKSEAIQTAAAALPAGKRLDIPIPVNRVAKGLRIPSCDGTGKLQMFFNMDVALRVDEDHLRMTNLKIETYDDEARPDMDIHMPCSLLDLRTNVISSAEPVTIHRSDFVLTGANATFNTQTRQGRFTGPVRMLIFNRDDLTQPEAQNPEQARK